ncbi:hypothetical protein BDQ17DRAFT_1246014, partial [Cyathus striatus]
ADLIRVTVTITVFHGLAILSTCFRLYHRFRNRRLWWDDFWALVSMLVTIVVLGAFVALPFRILFTKSKTMVTFGYWLTMLSYTTALWSARMSVAVTIVRLFNEGRARRCAKVMCIIFALAWTALVVQKFSNCGKFTVLSWRCPISHVTAYLELSSKFIVSYILYYIYAYYGIADIIADIWLLSAPMYMLWKIRLPSRRHQRLIRAVFACDVLVSVPSIVHIVYIVRKNQPAIGISAQFQVSTSLIVCNLLVVVTYVYRAFRRNEEESSDSSDKSTTSTHQEAALCHPHSIATTYHLRRLASHCRSLKSLPSLRIPILFRHSGQNYNLLPALVKREQSRS